MEYKCEFLEKPAHPVLSIRTRASLEDIQKALGDAYGSLMQYMGELGENPADAPFVAYYNMDMSDLDMEVGFPVSKPISGRGEINQSEIPAGKQVSCIHIGPYAGSVPAYEALTKWVEENGYEAVGVVYEFYLNDPMETPEDQLATRIMYLLK